MHALADPLAQAAGDVFQEGLDGTVGMDAHELIGIQQIGEMRGLGRCQRMLERGDHGELVAEQRRDVQAGHIDIARHQPQVARASAYRNHDIARYFFFELHVHVRVFRKKRGQRISQE